MSRLKTVLKFEFGRTVNKRSFWVRTLAIPLLLAVVLALSIFSGKAADQADQKAQTSPFSIVILDESGYISAEILSASKATTVASKATGIAQAKLGQTEAFFYYPANPAKAAVEIYAKDDGLVNNGKYEAVAKSLLQAGVAQSIGGDARVQLLQRGPITTTVTYKNGQETKGFGRAIVPGLFLVLFYAVIVLLGNQMLTSTTEEKENRVIEMILTSVSARTIIVGKIISLITLGLIQILVILIPVLIAYFGFRSQLHIAAIDLTQLSFAPLPILVGALIFVGGFLLFTGMLVAIGSAVPTAKEAGGYFAFAIILVFIPFYAIGAIVSSPDQLIVKVLSFFPLTAPITLMLRNAVGNLSPMQSVVGIAIVLLSGAALMALAIRIFRFGSLEYSRKLGLKEIFTRRT